MTLPQEENFLQVFLRIYALGFKISIIRIKKGKLRRKEQLKNNFPYSYLIRYFHVCLTFEVKLEQNLRNKLGESKKERLYK
jgi:hypothetical protein